MAPHRSDEQSSGEQPRAPRSIWSMSSLAGRDLQRLLLSPMTPLFTVTASVFVMLTHRGASAYDPAVLAFVIFASAVVSSFAAGLLGARPKWPIAVLTGFAAGGSMLLVGSKIITALVSTGTLETASALREMLFWSIPPAIILATLACALGSTSRRFF